MSGDIEQLPIPFTGAGSAPTGSSVARQNRPSVTYPRTCLHCHLTKPESEWYKHSGRTYVHPWCRACRLEAQHKYQSANREKINASQKRRRQLNPILYKSFDSKKYLRVKEEFFTHYGARCTCCGETHREFLTIEHVNGDGKEHRKRIKRTGVIFDLKRLGWPDWITVLCWNCNAARRFGRKCPHEVEQHELI